MRIDEVLMKRCIDKAWEYQTLTLPNPAVAAMVYDDNGEILSLEAHQKAGLPHAEVLAVFWAFVQIYAQSKQKNLHYQKVDSSLESTFATSHTTPPQALGELETLAPLWQDFQATHTEFSHIALEALPLHSHAIHAFIAAYHNGAFYDKTILLTLEPCNHFGKTPPCAQLIAQIAPKRVLIAARDIWGESANGSKRLQEAGVAVEFITNTSLKKQAQNVLYPFLCLRESRRFVVFKLAERLDGSYKNGQISGDLSRIFTHNQRAIAQSLIISGATARADRPRLDTRYATPPYANTSVPNVGIFTHKDIDSNIPLFHIDSRSVRIYDDKTLQELPNGFHIIEGSLQLFSHIYPLLKSPLLLLVHLSPTIAQAPQALCQSIARDISCEILHTTTLGKDLLLWLKP